jgi:hypothetical protein
MAQVTDMGLYASDFQAAGTELLEHPIEGEVTIAFLVQHLQAGLDPPMH